ncbi:hypothetical protein BDV28DRAFT_147896, partial [Aspergillus coremiiformis]
MPGDEYSVGGGGKLKLKGSKASDGRIDKKKKKAKKNTTTPKEGGESTSAAGDEKSPPPPSTGDQDASDTGVNDSSRAGKTEAER